MSLSPHENKWTRLGVGSNRTFSETSMAYTLRGRAIHVGKSSCSPVNRSPIMQCLWPMGHRLVKQKSPLFCRSIRGEEGGTVVKERTKAVNEWTMRRTKYNIITFVVVRFEKGAGGTLWFDGWWTQCGAQYCSSSVAVLQCCSVAVQQTIRTYETMKKNEDDELSS